MIATVSTGIAILAIIGLLLGVVVLGIVVALFNGFVRPLLEIRRYASDILTAGLGIARGVDGVDELLRTRELGGALPGLAGAYLARLRGPQP